MGIESILRVASAHKVPIKCYELIKEYEKQWVVFITLAEKSNALSGFTVGRATHEAGPDK
jgi:5-(carboxyamino)imidazole ribonucleotide mutase